MPFCKLILFRLCFFFQSKKIPMIYEFLIIFSLLYAIWNYKPAKKFIIVICVCIVLVVYIISRLLLSFLLKIFLLCLKLIYIIVAVLFTFCYFFYRYFINTRQSSSSTRIIENQQFCICGDCVSTIQNARNPEPQLCLPMPKIKLPKIKKKRNLVEQNIMNYPIITFQNNQSYISIFNEIRGKYEALEEWNGNEGKQLFISFDAKKPKYCENAFEMLKAKPSSVVYDLIYIMSSSPGKLKKRSKWGFKITKDEENPILLEFDNFDGTRKAASPQFLMAMLLKQHVKAITANLGKKPNQIAYVLDNLDNKKYNRVNPLIIEAFSLIKIDALPFVQKQV